MTLYDNTASLQDRTVATGILKTRIGTAIWRRRLCRPCLGARLRCAARILAYPPYDRLSFEVPTLQEGDVNARVWVRIREVEQSLALIEQILARLPDGPIREPQLGPRRVKASRWWKVSGVIFWSG